VLGWSLSNTTGADLCLEALEMALSSTDQVPEISNTDLCCQFTSAEWTGRLTCLGVKISMDGKGRWMDNVLIEQLWRNVKYKRINFFEYATLPTLHGSLEEWFDRYNHWRPHEKSASSWLRHDIGLPTPNPGKLMPA
jgi:putative transposase